MTESARTRQILFTLLNVPFTVTDQSWRFVPPKIVIGILAAFALLPFPTVDGEVIWRETRNWIRNRRA